MGKEQGLAALRNSNVYRSRFVRIALAASLLGGIFGYVYSRLAYPDSPAWVSAIMGALIWFCAVSIKMLVQVRSNAGWQQAPFWLSLLVKPLMFSVVVVTIIFAGIYLESWITGSPFPVERYHLGEYAQDLVAAALVFTLFQFVLQMRFFIGGKTLLNLVLGRYNKPVEEERIFLIVDLVGSTPIARKIGDLKFHQFLSEIYALMDRPIAEYGGEIHSYVGDALIAVWPLGDAQTPRGRQKNARVIMALKDIIESINERGNHLETLYGVRPVFRAALHAGEVVIGETGYSKRQITYLGDTVNIAARIEQKAKQLGVPYVLSGYLHERIDWPEGIGCETLGQHDLKGVDQAIELWKIEFGTKEHSPAFDVHGNT